jgi:hypothetical protein
LVGGAPRGTQSLTSPASPPSHPLCFDRTERKRRINAPVSDDDLLEAYAACGGEADGGGCVNADILVRVIKEDFELAIDIQELIAAVDEDGSGEIEFDEFKTLLSTALSLGGDEEEE